MGARTPRFAPGAGSGGGAADTSTNPYAGAEVFSLFVPGVVVARNVGVWRNARPSGKARALALEANLLTAPTAGSPGNYWEIRAFDALGASMVLPISDAAVSHYAQNLGTAVVIARPKLNGGGPAGGATTEAVGIKFKPTQDLAVAGIIASTALSNFNDTANYGARALRGSLLDANGTRITSVTATTTGPVIGDIQWMFPLPITLLAGTTYYAVIDSLAAYTAIAGVGGNAASGTDPGLALPTIYAAQAAPIAMVGLGGCILTNGDGTTPRAAVSGMTVSDAIQGRLAPHQAWSDGGSTPLGAVGLLGLGGQTTFTGDVTLSYAAIGAPPAGAAGSDVNMRILLGEAA